MVKYWELCTSKQTSVKKQKEILRKDTQKTFLLQQNGNTCSSVFTVDFEH